MTIADAPALFDLQPPTAAEPTTTPTTDEQVPAPVDGILAALPPGWTTAVRLAVGTLDKGERAAEPNASGVRPTIVRTLDVESVGLRARHHDGRHVAAVWAREVGARTPGGRAKSYGLVLAWRGRHHDEQVPATLAAGEVTPYLTADDPDAALRAVEQVRADLAERAARTAATKRANAAAKRRRGADVVELHPRLDEAELGEVAA